MSTIVAFILLFLLGGFLGVGGAVVLRRLKPLAAPSAGSPLSEPSREGSGSVPGAAEIRPREAEGEKAEDRGVRRVSLWNETGNILISTTLDPSSPMPEGTQSLFSEALAHLAAVFFAIAGSRDERGNRFSLYNYAVLKRALALHPVFIPVAENPKLSRRSGRADGALFLMGSTVNERKKNASTPKPEAWLEQSVRNSRDSFDMDDSFENDKRLRAIHWQLRAEAQRLRGSEADGPKSGKRAADAMAARAVFRLGTKAKGKAGKGGDEMEVGQIILYCECLMGVSIVSLRLMHAHYREYLEKSELEQDTYLFVSPSRLKATIDAIDGLPSMRL